MNGNSEREAKRNDDARPAGLASLSEPAIKRRLLSDAVQHPATLLPLAGSIASALYLLLVSPVLGGSIWAAGLLALTGVVSIASFSWRYVFRYTEEYAKRARELMELLDRERARLEQVEVGQLREALQSGFSRVGDTDGLEALTELDAEYDQLQLALSRQIDGDLLSMSQVPGLAREAYRQGLSVLSDALDLTKVASKPGRERLEREVERLEKDIEGARGDDMQGERLRIKEDTLTSHRQRLELLDQLGLRQAQMLFQVDRCEASLHRTRIELAAIKTGSSEASVDSVIEALQGTISQVKGVQEELRRLGY